MNRLLLGQPISIAFARLVPRDMRAREQNEKKHFVRMTHTDVRHSHKRRDVARSLRLRAGVVLWFLMLTDE
jgi:hypothetical protein